MGFNKDSAFKQEEQRQSTSPVTYEEIQRINRMAAEAAERDAALSRWNPRSKYGRALGDIRAQLDQYQADGSMFEEALYFIDRIVNEAGF